MEIENGDGLKRVGSIVDRIQVFTLLAKKKVRSAVALDARLIAKILQILQALTRNLFSGFSNSLISFNKSRKCSYVPTCLTRLHAHMPTCFACLRAHVQRALRAYVLMC